MVREATVTRARRAYPLDPLGTEMQGEAVAAVEAAAEVAVAAVEAAAEVEAGAEVEAHPMAVEYLPPAQATAGLEGTAEELEVEVAENLPPADPILVTLGPHMTGN
jgi:hypothetical protein